MEKVKLDGKVIISGYLRAVTGLHIGAERAAFEIGGVDMSVVRDAEGRPYIPGSSLKGKMRALLERAEGKELNKIVSGEPLIRIHECVTSPICEVCKIFGVSGEVKVAEPTRLIVRDGKLDEKSVENLKTDLPYTEIKWETVIDRITSQAMPRQLERVPAGARFEINMIYSVLEGNNDKLNLKKIFEAMSLLEHDYLGGQGSRGHGRVKFEDLKIIWYPKEYYETGDSKKQVSINEGYTTVESILQNFEKIQTKMVIKTS